MAHLGEYVKISWYNANKKVEEIVLFLQPFVFLKEIWYNMSVFNNILENWIQVVDNQNNITIEDYGYDTGVIEGTTKNHCVKCVAVNKCCFKNEENKKPKPFDITGIDILDSIMNGIIPGLYHFRCHCKEVPVQINSINEIELIVPEGKIPYLFKSKSGWIKSMGYQEKEFSEFFDLLLPTFCNTFP